MLEELDIQTIIVSPAASDAIRNIINERKLEGYALRVFVSGGGWLRWNELWHGA